MKGRLFAIVLLILASANYCAWTQPFNIMAIDQEGKAVEGANVVITYQKANRYSENDGRIEGRTDENGQFFAVLSNSVKEEFENRKVRISISHYYGGNETIDEVAENSENFKNVIWVAPFRVVSLSVMVSDSEGMPITGAPVSVYGIKLQKLTDELGIAVFPVAAGSPAAGVVRYKEGFYPFSAEGSNEDYLVAVVVPAEKREGNESKKLLVDIRVALPDETPVPFLPINLTYSGKKQFGRTDKDGKASFLVDGTGGNASLEFVHNEISYNKSYEVRENFSAKIVLEPALKITSFLAKKESENCYKVIANISDPRRHLPIEVQITKIMPYFNSTLPTKIEEGSLFYTQLCITRDTKVQASAWNKYDYSKSEIIELKYVAPSPQPPPPIPTLVLPPEKEEEISLEDMALSVAIFAVIGAAVAILITIKSRFGEIKRSITIFLRDMLGKMRPPEKAKEQKEEPKESKSNGQPEKKGKKAGKEEGAKPK
ncbi:MAG: hypothetical protein N3G22_03880 [Candidatus Micrarchaeota archaeon]|nr:hypothetical protein [Candidatus Micrarchaeota archaeon]